MTETELRELIGRSQEEGFRALFRQYLPYVYHIVWEHICSVGTKEDAEDCVSDVFLDVYQHLNRAYVGALQGFIGTVARRHAIDCFHRLCQNQNIPLEETLPAPEDVTETFSGRELFRLIRSLGEPDASIVLLTYYHKLSSADVASAVRLSPAAVRQRLSRARKRLKQLLEAAGYGKEEET